MGQIKNIKLHIVTDIKVTIQTANMRLLLLLVLLGTVFILNDAKPLSEVAEENEEEADDQEEEEDNADEGDADESDDEPKEKTEISEKRSSIEEENADTRDTGYGHN